MVLDTTVCVDLLRERVRGNAGPAHQAVATLGDRQVFLSVFSACELHTGAGLSSRPEEELRLVASFLGHVNLLYPEADFPVLYGEAAARLLAAGTPIPTMDLLIGITAKARGLPLLTRDRRHFHRIPGLAVESYGDPNAGRV